MAHFFVIANALNGSLIYYHSHIKELCLQNHTVFLSKQNLNQCSLLLDGPTYNMDFNPTESELLLYNSSKNKDFHSRLKDSFDLISL